MKGDRKREELELARRIARNRFSGERRFVRGEGVEIDEPFEDEDRGPSSEENSMRFGIGEEFELVKGRRVRIGFARRGTLERIEDAAIFEFGWDAFGVGDG